MTKSWYYYKAVRDDLLYTFNELSRGGDREPYFIAQAIYNAEESKLRTLLYVLTGQRYQPGNVHKSPFDEPINDQSITESEASND